MLRVPVVVHFLYPGREAFVSWSAVTAWPQMCGDAQRTATVASKKIGVALNNGNPRHILVTI